tara:strand:- start:690 stop:857 length:168 start_codon:yes stop_codon:yes gene_type:complete
LATKFSECVHEVRNIQLIDTTEKTTHYVKCCGGCASIIKNYGFKIMVKTSAGIIN